MVTDPIGTWMRTHPKTYLYVHNVHLVPSKKVFEYSVKGPDDEKKVTAWIGEIADLAVAEKDYATQNMLQWFINEQVEEEANATDVIWMLEMSAGSKGALFMADHQLAKRGKA